MVLIRPLEAMRSWRLTPFWRRRATEVILVLLFRNRNGATIHHRFASQPRSEPKLGQWLVLPHRTTEEEKGCVKGLDTHGMHLCGHHMSLHKSGVQACQILPKCQNKLRLLNLPLPVVKMEGSQDKKSIVLTLNSQTFMSYCTRPGFQVSFTPVHKSSSPSTPVFPLHST